MDEVGPDALGVCRIALGAGGMAMRMDRSDGSLTPEWEVGDVAAVAAADLEMALRPTPAQATGARSVHAAPLLYEGRRLGALVARGPLALGDDDTLFLQIVADMLAPMLGAAAHAQRLETEVAARTAEIERQRRFVAKVVDSLPVGL